MTVQGPLQAVYRFSWRRYFMIFQRTLGWYTQVGHHHSLPILCLITRRELTVCSLNVTLRRCVSPHGEFVFHVILKPLTDDFLWNWGDHNAAGARNKCCSRWFMIIQQQTWPEWFERPLYWDVERKWKNYHNFTFRGQCLPTETNGRY
jgi:hypothetical protein